jgi:hypothetical protein
MNDITKHPQFQRILLEAARYRMIEAIMGGEHEPPAPWLEPNDADNKRRQPKTDDA